MLKVVVGYPDRDEELTIVRRVARTEAPQPVEGILDPADFARLRALADSIYLDEKVEEYIVDLVRSTREPAAFGLEIGNLIEYGASPRATIYLALAAKAAAFLRGRGYVTPQDVKWIGMDVLRHRVLITYEAEAAEVTAEQIVQQIFDHLPVP
jgi:MoxR-like ATPase